jgi:hypothetical protein
MFPRLGPRPAFRRARRAWVGTAAGSVSATVDADTDNAIADGAAATLTHAASADANVAAVVADGTGASPAPASAISVEVTTEPADGTGTVPVPAVSGGR